MKANNLENKVDPNHVLWYWQTDLTLADNGGDFVLLWQDPNEATNQVVIDAFDYISTDAENEYFDISQPAGTPRPSVLTLRRDLTDQIERRQTMYEEFGLADMYYSHLNGRLDQTITQQLAYLESQNQDGWEFNAEVAEGEVRTAFYAANNNAYAPHSPEDYTLSPYQWYEAENNSQSSSVEGEVTYNTEAFKYRRERNATYYELSNHLGNVLVTVTDMKVGISTDGDFFAEYYEATVISANDYYPFGSAMAGRKYNQGSYRFGFNGKEEDAEWGSQMIQDYGFRIYNPTIGKFLSVDPLAPDYPWYTPYQFAGNMPIWKVDLDGLEPAETGAGDDAYDFQVPEIKGITRVGLFKIGKHNKPTFKYDNGFLDKYAPRNGTFGEKLNYGWWDIKKDIATVTNWSWGNSTGAYHHFLHGQGRDYRIDYGDYIDDDIAGKYLLSSVTRIAKISAVELAMGQEGVFSMTSDGISVSGTLDFPAPHTTDWQRTIGRHNIWMEATVSCTQNLVCSEVYHFSMTLTINAEDRYNFNPGMSDISTGIPDNENGVFEIIGLGCQFMSYGSHTVEINWSENINENNENEPYPIFEEEDQERF